MQLGELQSQIERFENRGVKIVAISVDPVNESRSMARRLELTFDLLSDSDQRVMQAYGVQNRDTKELALHAVFIVDEARRVFYRKVASRRPLAEELIDAIDFQYGRYPFGDTAIKRGAIPVAFPRNTFQALLEISTRSELPASISADSLQPVLDLINMRKTDAAVIEFRQFIVTHRLRTSQDDQLTAAAWLTRQALKTDAKALAAGIRLNSVLIQLKKTRDETQADDESTLHRLRAEQDELRAHIRANASRWNLQYTKTLLRGYRELVLAGLPST